MSQASLFSQNVEIISTPGTYSWVCPPGVTSVNVQAWGGGGGGGGASLNIITARGGGGGGGGAYATSNVTVIPGNSYSMYCR